MGWREYLSTGSEFVSNWYLVEVWKLETMIDLEIMVYHQLSPEGAHFGQQCSFAFFFFFLFRNSFALLPMAIDVMKKNC